jgi:hypothetical protein
MNNPSRLVGIAIPEPEQSFLIGLADNGEKLWVGVSEYIQAKIDECRAEGVTLNTTQLFGDVANLVGVRPSSIRQWLWVYSKCKDLIGVYPLRYGHWRMISSAARRDGESVADLAERMAATADDHGGMTIPVEALAARLAGKIEEKDELEDRLHRAVRSLGRLRKALEERKKFDQAARVSVYTTCLLGLLDHSSSGN